MDIVGECPICGINVYDQGTKNRPFTVARKQLSGYPAEKTMPCGIDRTNSTLADDKIKERCPFETAQEQEKIIIDLKKMGVMGKGSNYD